MTPSTHIVYRGVERSDAIDAYILEHVEKLRARERDVLSCHVALESPHRHKSHGRSYRVRIDLGLRGTELVVDHCPTSDRNHDAYAAIDDAFDAARRRVGEYTRRRTEVRHGTGAKP
jgi:ribosome-associated translation inhibitor RaiA